MMEYLQLLLCVRVAHPTLLDHGPESRVVEIIDMAYTNQRILAQPRIKMHNLQSTCLHFI